MRKLFLLILLFGAAAFAEDKIREFPIPTIVALGKELYQRDAIAATAFDALFDAHPEAQKLPMRGWITEITREHRRVYFIQEHDSKYSLAFILTFQKQDTPKIEDAHGAALPDLVEKRFTARRTAIAAIPKFMTERYNFEVLDAPDGKGFLVYALASTNDPDEIIVGGHYRVTVSADGTKAQQVDALSRSFLVLHKQGEDIPKDSKVVGYSMSHIVSNTPVETHVFVSLLHKVPLYVATSEKDVWIVLNGEISKANENEK